MKVFFSELDGTTWATDFPMELCGIELRVPVMPSMMGMVVGDPGVVNVMEQCREKRYRRMGFTNVGGLCVVFYDRVVDAEEVR